MREMCRRTTAKNISSASYTFTEYHLYSLTFSGCMAGGTDISSQLVHCSQGCVYTDIQHESDLMYKVKYYKAFKVIAYSVSLTQ